MTVYILNRKFSACDYYVKLEEIKNKKKNEDFQKSYERENDIKNKQSEKDYFENPNSVITQRRITKEEKRMSC